MRNSCAYDSQYTMISISIFTYSHVQKNMKDKVETGLSILNKTITIINKYKQKFKRFDVKMRNSQASLNK